MVVIIGFRSVYRRESVLKMLNFTININYNNIDCKYQIAHVFLELLE